LRRRLETEQESVAGMEGLLEYIAGMEELAGDPWAITDPDSFMS